MATKEEIERAWNEAQKIRSRNPNLYRRDEMGNVIYKPAYGTQGDKGCEVDHVKPVAKGGPHAAHNLRALQTAANREKSAKTPRKPR